ncbi:MAG: U32 family peptidase [Candidatus Omnitrophica bacterium]|nr:U32 family peptidase [Candidatus Omnitrophota bacterium]
MADKKTRFSIGLNGHPGNLEAILKELGNDIYEVYAPAPPDVCSTGRFEIVHVDRHEMRRQIDLAHQYGIQYNVLMNGSCHSGLQFSKKFREKILGYLNFLKKAKPDSITIADPYLMEFVSDHCTIPIVVGSFAAVNEPIKALRYQNKGARRIVLQREIYRDFQALQELRSLIKIDLSIIVNKGCIYQCDCCLMHINVNSHISMLNSDDREAYGNYSAPIEGCRTIRQVDPIEFLMSTMIRPEDLHLYEEMGYHTFKLSSRRRSTEWILDVARAYRERRYDGNVFDLSSHVVNPFINLPNKELDGWFEYTGNTTSDDFAERCRAFYKERHLEKYFSKKISEVHL